MVDETHAEEDEIRQAAEIGLADIEAGRYMTLATVEDGQRLHERLMAGLRTRLADDR